jgi:hypothetical protein
MRMPIIELHMAMLETGSNIRPTNIEHQPEESNEKCDQEGESLTVFFEIFRLRA